MKICFVGHAFHRKTRSSSFFIELLGRIGSVTEMYSDPDGDPRLDDALIVRLMQGGFDRYIFWQTELIAERLIARDLGLSFLVPMFDSVAQKDPHYWSRFVKHRFLSFSRAHHESLQRLGCQTDYFQYYPDPGIVADRMIDREANAAFFWERQPRSSVNMQRVLTHCRSLGIRSLHVHAAADFASEARPHQSATIDGIDVSVSRWLDNRAAFDVISGRPLFYFAPREREGIGMATLEALARGQIVVAPNYPTANEYLAHRVSSLLYDPTHDEASEQMTRPKDAELLQMSRAARRKAVEGRATWLDDVDRLLDIVADGGRRWSTHDYSANFVRQIRLAAHRRSVSAP